MSNLQRPLACCAVFGCVAMCLAPVSRGAGPMPPATIEYTAQGPLKFPANYREWVFLGSGLGMVYGPMAAMENMNEPRFDNVFVNPEAYRSFLNTGHWPDKTMFVLEVRNSASHLSINTNGHFQTELVGIEAEVKDKSARTGEWTFYGFGTPKDPATATAKAIGPDAACYSCHKTNTAVENTFVQFYPSLYGVAKSKATINPGFQLSAPR